MLSMQKMSFFLSLSVSSSSLSFSASSFLFLSVSSSSLALCPSAARSHRRGEPGRLTRAGPAVGRPALRPDQRDVRRPRADVEVRHVHSDRADVPASRRPPLELSGGAKGPLQKGPLQSLT